METETSVYRGIFSGDEFNGNFKGYRYFKDHRPYELWSVRYSSNHESTAQFIASVERERKEKKQPKGETSTENNASTLKANVSGKWFVGTPFNGTLVLNPDGTGYFETADGARLKRRWRLDGDTFLINDEAYMKEEYHEFIFKDNAIWMKGSPSGANVYQRAIKR